MIQVYNIKSQQTLHLHLFKLFNFYGWGHTNYDIQIIVVIL